MTSNTHTVFAMVQPKGDTELPWHTENAADWAHQRPHALGLLGMVQDPDAFARTRIAALGAALACLPTDTVMHPTQPQRHSKGSSHACGSLAARTASGCLHMSIL